MENMSEVRAKPSKEDEESTTLKVSSESTASENTRHKPFRIIFEEDDENMSNPTAIDFKEVNIFKIPSTQVVSEPCAQMKTVINSDSEAQNESEPTTSQLKLGEQSILSVIPTTSNDTQGNSDHDGSRRYFSSVSNQENTDNDKPEEPVSVFTEDPEPQWYRVKGNLVTPSIIPTNLPKVFKKLPIHGNLQAEDKSEVDGLCKKKLREFLGEGIDATEFEELSQYCSTDHLRTGKELEMATNFPTLGLLTTTVDIPPVPKDTNLCTLRKLRLRLNNDPGNEYSRKLKYRGTRLMPLDGSENLEFQIDEPNPSEINEKDVKGPPDLEPGQDILFRIRIYRPYTITQQKERLVRGRHAVFSSDVVLAGRQPLCALRDRLVCRNDWDSRRDVSARPTARDAERPAKDIFPSGFLFINNVFYVDTRAGCVDRSAGVRRWAARRALGRFPVRDMGQVKMADLVVKLGNPDVYVHQGDCEHIFIFSEVRLLGPRDPLRAAQFPAHGAVSQHQAVYCTTCAEFSAKWVVVGCERVPFEPSFFCDVCARLYLYKDGEKIGDFKAYNYRGNEINMLKPIS